uniref:ankyrin repeat and SOCS box protein 13a.1 isoform X2 n=1 Tax=Solea senegalensis TaxID=28829 RepID=UPI001CD8AE22|nr:ankyrin repeat and SOCS box protein 13a.1 isoform X2 [Solea senegalensis]
MVALQQSNMEVTAARRSFLCDIGFWADHTALHMAASQGRVLQLKQLIEGGASVNMVTVDNITPLHEACLRGHLTCARLLLEAGAQVDVRTIHGSTPLCHACSSGSLECAELLLEHGANVNPSLTALTASPLHEACIHGNVEVARLMIASGAQLEAYDVHFGPPLHIACAKGHVGCVRELLIADRPPLDQTRCSLAPRSFEFDTPVTIRRFVIWLLRFCKQKLTDATRLLLDDTVMSMELVSIHMCCTMLSIFL